MSEMLPAIAPAVIATIPSTVFQAIVKYSSRLPRDAARARLSMTSSAIELAYYLRQMSNDEFGAGAKAFEMAFFGVPFDAKDVMCCTFGAVVQLVGRAMSGGSERLYGVFVGLLEGAASWFVVCCINRGG
jgi:hypothetical protein